MNEHESLPNTRYCMSFGAQEEQIKKYCFERCKMICFGVINFMGGDFAFCTQEICEFEEKRLLLEKEPSEEDDEYEYVIRKLKEWV